MSDYSAIKKSVNSDVTGDPVNCLVYINSIESERENSYVLDKRNSSMFRDLIANSTAVFRIPGIHKLVFDRMSDLDVDYMVGRNARLGECINNFYEETIFTRGNIEAILFEITDEKMNKLDKKISDGIKRYIKSQLTSVDVCTYLSEKYNIPDIASYSTIKEFAAVKSVVDQVYANTSLMELLKYTNDFMNPIANDGELMIDLLERESVISLVETCDLWMHEILESNVGLGKFISYKSSFSLTAYTNYDAIIDKTSAINTVVANVEALSYVQRSDLGIAKTIVWRLGGNGTEINSMAEVMSNSELVTQIANSNGTSTDAIAILKNSIPGMIAAIASDEISAVVLNTLNVDAVSVAYACIMSETGKTRFDESETYGDLYAKIFDVKDTMDFLFGRYDSSEMIFATSKFVTKLISSDVASTSLSGSSTAVRALMDNDIAKKIVIDSDIPAEKLISSEISFSVISSRIRWASFVAYSYAMLKILVNDSEKISAILENDSWRTIFLNSWMAVDNIMKSSVALKFLKNSTAENKSFMDDLLESSTLAKHMMNVTSVYDSDVIKSEVNGDSILKKVLDGSTRAIIDRFDNIITRTESLLNALQTAVTTGGVPIIKSVQRGVGSADGDITINSVNPNKCIVLIDGVVTTTAKTFNVVTGGDWTRAESSKTFYWGDAKGGATVSSLTATKLTMSNVQNTFSWQVIEFF